MGRFTRAGRWLMNRDAGPVPRARRVAGVLRSTLRDRGPWRTLPEALATAFLAPVRRSPPSAPPAPPRDWAPERAAAARRLEAAAARLGAGKAADLRLAVIADAQDLAVLTAAAGHVLAIRPEGWVAELDAATRAAQAPELLLVTSAREGNGGAWTYRIGWYAHPDSFLHRDLRALLAWCAEHRIPSLFAARPAPAAAKAKGAATADPDVVRDFGDAALLFDLVLAPDAATADAFRELPGRRGAGVRVAARPADLADTIRGLGALLADAAGAAGAASAADAEGPAGPTDATGPAGPAGPARPAKRARAGARPR